MKRKSSHSHEQLTQLLKSSSALLQKMEHSRSTSLKTPIDIDDDDGSEERDSVLELDAAQKVVIEQPPIS